MTFRWLRFVLPLVCMISAVPGCSEAPSGPPHFETQGIVTFNSEPVPGAVVVFSSEKLRVFRGARTKDDGSFRVVAASNTGLPSGDYQVAVRPAPGGDEEPVNFNRPDIPEKYRSEATSGLTFTLEAGAPFLEIELAAPEGETIHIKDLP